MQHQNAGNNFRGDGTSAASLPFHRRTKPQIHEGQIQCLRSPRSSCQQYDTEANPRNGSSFALDTTPQQDEEDMFSSEGITETWVVLSYQSEKLDDGRVDVLKEHDCLPKKPTQLILVENFEFDLKGIGAQFDFQYCVVLAQVLSIDDYGVA
jgi:hypothetical protein